MNDIYLELARAITVLIIFSYLLNMGRKSGIHKQSGWMYIISGFGFLVFASFIDFTDNFESLSRYIVIGDTPIQAFLEKVVGYLFGFLLLAVGFFKWLPKITIQKQTEQKLLLAQKKLETINTELEKKVTERTTELENKIKETAESSGKIKELNSSLELKNKELGKINKFMVGRELKMIELKKKIEQSKRTNTHK